MCMERKNGERWVEAIYKSIEMDQKYRQGTYDIASQTQRLAGIDSQNQMRAGKGRDSERDYQGFHSILHVGPIRLRRWRPPPTRTPENNT